MTAFSGLHFACHTKPRPTGPRRDISVRELARVVRRDVKRAHEDVIILAGLGLLERTESAGVVCPYASMPIDMYLKAA